MASPGCNLRMASYTVSGPVRSQTVLITTAEGVGVKVGWGVAVGVAVGGKEVGVIVGLGIA